MKLWLLDTGPLVAYLVREDPAHERVSATLGPFTGQLATTGAVITEAMHFAARSPSGPRLLSDFVAGTDLSIFDLTQPAALDEAVKLMEQYADTPMDFADATLLLLAEHLDAEDLLTLDRRGFSTYRTRDGRMLRSVLP